jgi:hypothetical protein
MESAGGSAAIQHDHIPVVAGQWETQSMDGSAASYITYFLWADDGSQKVVLQLSSKITYPLWPGNGRGGVSR